MSINAPLLKQTLAKIEAEPERWYQGWWLRHSFDAEGNVCGTAYCFAGHATLLHGAKLGEIPDEDIADEEPYVFVKPPPGEPLDIYKRGDLYETKDGELPGVAAYARTVLGLDIYQSSELFAEKNTLDDLRRIVAELCEQADSEVTP